MSTRAVLGILAGGGDLPARLAAACRAQGRPYFVLAFRGHADAAALPADADLAWIRLGEAGTGLALLRSRGVEEIVLAGAVRRPTLRELLPDARTARFFARAGFKALGDDSLLRGVVEELEAEGFRVVAAETIVDGILAAAGVWGRVHPDASAEADIARGVAVARGLGDLDVGQAVVVQQGIVLGVEAVEGTDALLRRCASLRRAGAGGVLVKLAKPGQERRVDLPAIGPETVRLAAEAGLAGLAVEAGGALVLDRAQVVAAADAAGLFVCGVAADAPR